MDGLRKARGALCMLLLVSSGVPVWAEDGKTFPLPDASIFDILRDVTDSESWRLLCYAVDKGLPENGPIRPIAIRADRPFALRFSDEPELTIGEPSSGSDKVFHRGKKITLSLRLRDPGLDSDVHEIRDLTRKTSSYQSGGRDIPVYAQLLPRVAIANAAGQEVASETMAYLQRGNYGYSWEVPADLPLAGERETFTATVTFDTRQLYGVVKATCQLVLTAN